MDLTDLAELATRQLPPPGRADTGDLVRPLPRLSVFRRHRPSAFEAAVYEPVICLVLRGRKQTLLGSDAYPLRPGELLLISHDLPVVARVTKAPYLAVLFDLDVALLRDLYTELAGTVTPTAAPRSISVHTADPLLVDALARYLALASHATDAAVLGPLITRELHYRLATARYGTMLRHLIQHDSHASAIARAIAALRRDFRAPIAIPALAKTVGMSASAFHKHFKAITWSSPLQFQKDLRLLEARRQLRAGTTTVAEAAFAVGYESPTQFSREYARKFGAPPKRDLPSPPRAGEVGTFRAGVQRAGVAAR